MGQGDVPAGQGDVPVGQGDVPVGQRDVPVGQRDVPRRWGHRGGATPPRDKRRERQEGIAGAVCSARGWE